MTEEEFCGQRAIGSSNRRSEYDKRLPSKR
jgi:hypothetical protein